MLERSHIAFAIEIEIPKESQLYEPPAVGVFPALVADT